MATRPRWVLGAALATGLLLGSWGPSQSGASPKLQSQSQSQSQPKSQPQSQLQSQPKSAVATKPAGARAHHRTPPPAVESGLLPWQLPVPVSRAAVVAGTGSELTILGGLEPSGASSSSVFALDTTDGALQQIATLPIPVHDGAGASVAGRAVVFGGGAPATDGVVQGVAAGPAATGQQLGQLPAPRSDDAVVSIGRVTYVVGGYNGTSPDPQVLATTDGSHFASVASLKVPVRYPAVAAMGTGLYIFGGQAISTGASNPVDDIQRVDPASHTTTVVGHLPEPLAGASAVVLGRTIYLFGGNTTAPGTATPAPGGTATVPGSTNGTIWAFDPRNRQMLVAGRLQVPVSYAGAAVLGSTAWVVGGENSGGQVAAVQMLRPNAGFGTAGAPGAGTPYFGDRLLVADRGNNRLLLLDDTMRATWSYPPAPTGATTATPSTPAFYFPDDAFFIRHGTAIISNQEQNETIVEIAYPSGQIVWSYGHAREPGAAPGYLDEPDDAYLLPNGDISVADAQNCRILVISTAGAVLHQIGSAGHCVHDPPTAVGSPNGDTPLVDGNLLVSEINGSWVSEYTTSGSLVWTVQLPIGYPSDPQQIGPDTYLVADYSSPGGIVEFNRAGQILYRYDVTSGPGELNHPSLAEQLPSGAIMLNDDYNDRMVAIDPATNALVWQYGATGEPGTTAGMLNTPDGFDVVTPDGSTPTHVATG